mmetsp:Transcript_32816/g.77788  ORF Transcript_32816/g.77788 Transcript_32816/m.77788 type:complete len:739 (+) Transcript_32816:153-2369(+)
MPSILEHGATDLSDICRQLTTLGDINRLLHEVVARERSIDAELEQQLSKRKDVEDSLMSLSTSTDEVLDLMRIDAEQLHNSVSSTAQLAEKVSSKVRELDTASNNVREVLSRINLVMDRSNCIETVKLAMESEDYETAAQNIATYSQLRIKADQSMDEVQVRDQEAVLKNAQQELVKIVREKFREAVSKRDHASVVRFTKLHVPLALTSEGLEAFTGYLCQLIAVRAAEDYSVLADAVGQNSASADFVGVLTNLFKDIAIAADDNSELLKECFGPEGLLHTVLQLQAQCDTAGSRVLTRYLEHRQLQRLVREVSGSKRGTDPPLGSPDRVTVVDPRQVEVYLEEIVMLSQRSEEYNEFMLSRLREAAADPVGAASHENAFRGGQFNCTVREVIGYYITLEEYYVEEMVSKAVRLDELADGQLVSSMVDDTFFIMQKCARRSLATGSLQCSCAVLTELNNIISGAFRSAVGGRLSNCAQRLLSDMPAEAAIADTDPSERPHEAAVSMNCAETSGSYVTKLRQDLESVALELFPASQDRERIKSCLADLAKTSSDFHNLAGRALDSVAAAFLNRLRGPLDEVAQTNYQPSEAEYSAMEAEELWTQRLLVTVEASLYYLSPMLVPANYDALVVHLVEKVTARLEAIFAKKRFNQLGGLQLDRDIRNLVSHLSEFTNRAVRDKFARLTQMATVLSLETPNEILDYWGDNSGPITWRWNAAEVRRLLELRVDFSQASLNALRL